MSDEKQDPLEVLLAGVAWAQFIAVSSVVDKADMRDVHGALDQISSSAFIWNWDWTKFGGVAIALNVFALCLLTIPALGRTLDIKPFRKSPDASKAFYEALLQIGFYSWLLSFAVFIAYLNFLSVLCLYLAMAIIAVLFIYHRPPRRKVNKG